MIYAVARGIPALLLFIALGLCAAVFSPAAARRLNAAQEINPWLGNIAQALAAAVLACLLIMLAGLLRADPELGAAAQISPELSPSLRAAALWAGAEGSLLFWTAALATAGGLFALSPHSRRLPGVTAFYFWGYYYLMLAFFLFLLCVFAEPFAPPAHPHIYNDASGGLSPALRHSAMLFHPPLIFLGYAALGVAAALGLARLTAGPTPPSACPTVPFACPGESAENRCLRRWLSGGLALLGAGVTAGMWWAYAEAGWGGYWTWDAVENMSLLPCLAAAAALSAARLELSRPRTAAVASFLAMLPAAAALFATFVTRSGILNSKHAYSLPPSARTPESAEMTVTPELPGLPQPTGAADGLPAQSETPALPEPAQLPQQAQSAKLPTLPEAANQQVLPGSPVQTEPPELAELAGSPEQSADLSALPELPDFSVLPDVSSLSVWPGPEGAAAAALVFALLLAALGGAGLWRAPKAAPAPLGWQEKLSLLQIFLLAALALALSAGTFWPLFSEWTGAPLRLDSAYFVRSCLPAAGLCLLCELLIAGRRPGPAQVGLILLALGLVLSSLSARQWDIMLRPGQAAVAAATASAQALLPPPLARLRLHDIEFIQESDCFVARINIVEFAENSGRKTDAPHPDSGLGSEAGSGADSKAAPAQAHPAAPARADREDGRNAPSSPVATDGALSSARPADASVSGAMPPPAAPLRPNREDGPARRLILEQQACGGQVRAKTAFRHGLAHDWAFTPLQLYPDHSVLVRVKDSPFVNLIWAGAALTAAGLLGAALPLRRGSGRARPGNRTGQN